MRNITIAGLGIIALCLLGISTSHAGTMTPNALLDGPDSGHGANSGFHADKLDVTTSQGSSIYQDKKAGLLFSSEGKGIKLNSNDIVIPFGNQVLLYNTGTRRAKFVDLDKAPALKANNFNLRNYGINSNVRDVQFRNFNVRGIR